VGSYRLCGQNSRRMHRLDGCTQPPRKRTMLSCRALARISISAKNCLMAFSSRLACGVVSCLIATRERRHSPSKTSPYAPAPSRRPILISEMSTAHDAPPSSERLDDERA